MDEKKVMQTLKNTSDALLPNANGAVTPNATQGSDIASAAYDQRKAQYDALQAQYKQAAQSVMSGQAASPQYTVAGLGSTTFPGQPATQQIAMPTQPTVQQAQSPASSMSEFSQLAQKYASGTATIEDYYRAQQLIRGDGQQTPATQAQTTQTGIGTGQSAAGTSADAWSEWQAIMARQQAGTATIDDYYRAQQLVGMMQGASPYTPPVGTEGAGEQEGTGGGTGTGSTSTESETATVTTPDRAKDIEAMYDALRAQQVAKLQEAGDQALSDAEAERDKIAGTYKAQREAAAVDWERQRRNFLEGAATSGINTGAGSQAELSMMGSQQRSQTALGAAQAQAETEAGRNIADIKRSTQASIAEAIAENDYKKAAALLDEYNRMYEISVDKAKQLAAFGDFSGYADLYGQDQADQMAQTWAMQNPEIALAMGKINQQQYLQLTLYKDNPMYALTGIAGMAGVGGYGGGGYGGGGGSYGGGYDASGSAGTSSTGYPSLADLAREAQAAGASQAEILQALEDIYADGNYGPD